MSQGKPLRRCVDLSFLQRNSGSSGLYYGTAALYEAQISCAITGQDNWAWTAYCFVDTYFEKDSTDDVNSYWDEVEGDEVEYQFVPDPLTRGNLDATVPVSDPRRYFLIVLQIRFLQVKNAWRDLIENLQPGIRQYISHHQMSILERESSDGGTTSASDSSVWIAQSLDVINQLQYSISQTALEFDRFIDGDANYFTDQDSFGKDFIRVKDTWKSIKHTRHELGKLDSLLGQLVEQCKDFRKDIEMHLSIRRNQLAVDSRGKYDMTTSILFIFLPILLAASFFSMGSSTIPLHNPTFASFVVTILITYFSIWLVSMAVSQLFPKFESKRCWEGCRAAFHSLRNGGRRFIEMLGWGWQSTGDQDDNEIELGRYPSQYPE
ncbi:hypothetical protein BKA56DRAFT_196791 [Ilyonectria sp. MPI-CAGE-AT-0026]|nr:hypothetical protein BKA56DRAFT_196791 [Ilyonectria sp. MPI-CAGE-AT-0026]